MDISTRVNVELAAIKYIMYCEGYYKRVVSGRLLYQLFVRSKLADSKCLLSVSQSTSNTFYTVLITLMYAEVFIFLIS